MSDWTGSDSGRFCTAPLRLVGQKSRCRGGEGWEGEGRGEERVA